jgi:hypothetical protein
VEENQEPASILGCRTLIPDDHGGPFLKKFILLSATHVAALLLGFALGIYLLPILIAPEAPSAEEIRATASGVRFTGEFRRDLADSDALHWGEGTVSIGRDMITLEGRLAPGPDYRLYLSPAFVETEAEFNRLKVSMVEVGPVRTFENFIVPLSPSIDPGDYSAIIVWCESFGQFITAAEYSPANRAR